MRTTEQLKRSVVGLIKDKELYKPEKRLNALVIIDLFSRVLYTQTKRQNDFANEMIEQMEALNSDADALPTAE